MQSNYINTAEDPLNLDRIRNILVRLEDTIIFCIIERAQFALNPRIYQRGAFKELKELGFDGSWLEWFLKEIETFHAKARRYTSPDEYPFTKDLPPPIIPPPHFPKILYQHPNCRDLNVNASILSFYSRNVVPRMTQRATLALAAKKRAKGIVGDEEYEDDDNYGSAATTDVELLQAISKRVHYGKFVSESKFQSDPAAFIPHILGENRDGLEALIYKPAVEKALLNRLWKKASIYGADLGPDGQPIKKRSVTNGSENSSVPPVFDDVSQYEYKIDIDEVKRMYENWIIPLTKEVEVEYLIHRLDGLSEAEIDDLQKNGMPKKA